MRRALVLLLLVPPLLWWLTRDGPPPVIPPAPVAVPVDGESPVRESGPVIPGDTSEKLPASTDLSGEAGPVRSVGAEDRANRLRFLRTLRNDENSLYRRMALSNVAPLVERDPEVRRAIVVAAGDPDPKIRALAVSVLGGIAGLRTDARQVILRSLSDPDRKVRAKAAAFLANLGETGGRRALEALFEREWSGDGLDDLCSHIAEFGLVPDALDRKPSTKVTAHLLRHLCFEVDNDHPEYAKPLHGQYAGLVADFVPDANHGWKEFFEMAEAGGDGYLIRPTVLDAKSPEAVRLGALAATIRRDDKGREFFDLVDRLISGRSCPEEMRVGIIDHLDTMRVAHPEHRANVRGILQGMADSDPSEGVRKTALEYSTF